MDQLKLFFPNKTGQQSQLTLQTENVWALGSEYGLMVTNHFNSYKVLTKIFYPQKVTPKF